MSAHDFDRKATMNGQSIKTRFIKLNLININQISIKCNIHIFVSIVHNNDHYIIKCLLI